jgi:hypothetical protein
MHEMLRISAEVFLTNINTYKYRLIENMAQVDFMTDLSLEVCLHAYCTHESHRAQIGQLILNYVDGLTLLQTGLVSRRWRTVGDDERVWRALLLRTQLSHTIGLVLVFNSSVTRADQPSTPAWLTFVRPLSKAVYMRHRRLAVKWRSRSLHQRHMHYDGSEGSVGVGHARIAGASGGGDVVANGNAGVSKIHFLLCVGAGLQTKC